MQRDLEECYRELDLKPGASLQQVKGSYYELAKVWHPDRFPDQPRLLQKAHQKMTAINLAYERIRKANADEPHSRPAPDQANAASARQQGTHHTGQAWINSLGMKFVPVGGTLVSFSIWETRVQDYAVYVRTASGVNDLWNNPGFDQAAMHPVVNVSWDDAKRFCLWLTERDRREGRLPTGCQYRLPTDAEWSWAVGIGETEEQAGSKRPPEHKDGVIENGGNSWAYPWGRSWPPPKGCGNYGQVFGVDSFDYTSPVGTFTANLQGLYDLGGNVREWCEDFYSCSDGCRTLRGASWYVSGNPRRLLSSYRNYNTPSYRSNDIGFRCVLMGGGSR